MSSAPKAERPPPAVISRSRESAARRSLAELYPHLETEWHPLRNHGVLPADLPYASNRWVWWKCPNGEDHEWEASPSSRTVGKQGCPFCAGKRVAKDNSLRARLPEIAETWHPTRNGDLTPDRVTAGSRRRVWWRCRKDPDHEWDAIISLRAKRGCPFCAGRRTTPERSLATHRPDLVEEWHKERNARSPDEFSMGSNVVVWWICRRDPTHEWAAQITKRAKRGYGCPFCSGHRVAPSGENSLAARAPDLARSWHPEKNGARTPRDVTPVSDRPVWWRCDAGPDHDWRTSPANRTRGTGCPFCQGRKVSVTNCLAVREPERAARWHPIRNGSLTPWDVTPGSGELVWWNCNAGPDHEWSTPLYSRGGCPFCANKRVSVTNCLANVSPDIARQWHPDLNRPLLPSEIVGVSTRQVWWRCDAGHAWRASVRNRVRGGSGCPVCGRRRKRRPVLRRVVKEVIHLPSDWS